MAVNGPRLTVRRAILIVDERLDAHARFVATALLEQGHHVVRWHIDEQAAADISVFVCPRKAPRLLLPGASRPVEPSVVWWKRGHFPELTAALSGVDKALAQREWPPFLIGIEQILGDAWHVNSQEARRRSNAKAFQLALADRCGLVIPRTLFTNDAARARQFTTANGKGGGTVVKLLAPHFIYDGAAVTDRRNGARDDRRNGASWKWRFRHPERGRRMVVFGVVGKAFFGVFSNS